MHENKFVWHEKNIGTIWETSHRCCIMRKVIHTEVTAGGRFDFFLDSDNNNIAQLPPPETINATKKQRRFAKQI